MDYDDQSVDSESEDHSDFGNVDTEEEVNKSRLNNHSFYVVKNSTIKWYKQCSSNRVRG